MQRHYLKVDIFKNVDFSLIVQSQDYVSQDCAITVVFTSVTIVIGMTPCLFLLVS